MAFIFFYKYKYFGHMDKLRILMPLINKIKKKILIKTKSNVCTIGKSYVWG